MRWRSRARPWVLAAPYLAIATIVTLAAVFHGNPPFQRALDGVGYMLMELFGIAFCLRAAAHPALDPRARRPWRYLAIAFGLLLIGSIGYSMSVGTGSAEVTPALLVGFVGRLLFIGVLLRGLLLFEMHPLSRRGIWKVVLDVATIVGGGLMVAWYFLVGPALTMGGAQHDLIWSTAVVYTVGDLLLVFGVSMVLLRGTATAARRPLGLLLAGCVGYLGLDIYLTYVSVHNLDLWLPGSGWFTIAVLTPLFIMVSAAVEQVRLAGSGPGRPMRRLVRRPTWLPYAALVLGFSLLILAAVRTSAYPWWGLVAGAVLTTLAVAARQIIALRENHALVITDSLTGLASRAYLRDAIGGVSDRGPDLVAVLEIDLDDFKRINDLYGHETGDAYLIAFADVIRHNVRSTDTAARLGGDEFAVILNGVRSVQQAVGIAERILVEAAGPVPVAGHPLRLHASVGIAVAPASHVDADDILQRADQAMYVAKRRRTHGWQLYAEGSMEDDRDSLRRLVGGAAGAGQLRLEYQPIVALATGDLVAVEALLRWQHPTRGLVPPLEFIPLAEESGAINEIGLWVVDQASRQVAQWQRQLPSGRTLQLTVNLSPRQLAEPTLASDIVNVLNRNGFPPSDFVVEVTEGSVVEDGVAVDQLEALRALGVRIALDDFGTGYSSLRYLTRLPIDILKLDRCFVGELNGRPEGSAVAEAVIRLAQILHLDTIAEGIEDPATATELTLYGYRNAQGFHFSRPLAAIDMGRIIDSAGDTWPNLSDAGSVPTADPPAGSRAGTAGPG